MRGEVDQIAALLPNGKVRAAEGVGSLDVQVVVLASAELHGPERVHIRIRKGD